METETEQRAGRLTISLPQKRQSQSSSVEWRTRQLVAMAEVFREPLTAECLAMYVESLADLSEEQIRLCVGRAIRELKWFPKPAELRAFVGGHAEDQTKVEAEAAWVFANDYLRTWGVERLPVYRGGERMEAPSLPARVEYALRRIGGLRGLNQITEEARPFMFRDFCEAYKQAPIAELQAPGLHEKFGSHHLLGEAKQLVAGIGRHPRSRPASMNAAEGATAQAKLAEVLPIKPNRIPEPPTDAQIHDRREMLRQQAASLTHAANSKHQR
jgi:hypothetical protein